MKKAITDGSVEPLYSMVLHTHLTLIEVAEPHILAELKADRRLAPWIVAQISDRVAIVAPGGDEPLIKQLLKAGHTPKVLDR